MPPARLRRACIASAASALAAALALEIGGFVAGGRSLIDEGVYLVAARRVLEGALPYRDFPFSQGPGLPLLLAPGVAAWGTDLLAARVAAGVAFALGAAAAAAFAARAGGSVAGVLALALVAIDLPTLWAGTTVRTQAFATPLVLCGLLALTGRWRGAAGFALAPTLVLWATAIRLTHVGVLAAVLLATARALRGTLRRRVAAAVALQAAFLATPLWIAPGATWTHVVLHPFTRGERGGLRHEGLADAIAGKLAFLADPTTSFAPLLALGALAAAHGIARAARRGRSGPEREAREAAPPGPVLPTRDAAPPALAALGLAALAFAPHLLFEHVHFEYFTASAALLAPAVALAVVDAWRRGPAPRGAVAGVVAVVLAAGGLHAARQVDRFVHFGPGSLVDLRAQARVLRPALGPDCTLVTFQTHVAAALGCDVLPGLEYSLFSFFRDLEPAEARARGVLTPALLERAVREAPPTGFALTSAYAGRLVPEGAPRPLARGPGALAEGIPAPPGAYPHRGAIRVASGRRLPGFPPLTRVHLFLRRTPPASGPGTQEAAGAAPGTAPAP